MPTEQHLGRSLDRQALIDWYRRNRARSRAIFDLVAPDAYYSRPIALRHPIVFYEGHLPAFSANTLLKRGLGRQGVDPALDTLFARGIDPADAGAAATAQAQARWPSRDEVHAYVRAADEAVLDALARDDIERPGHPVLDRAEGVFALLEHEAMHQETLLYIFHQLPYDQKRGAEKGLRESFSADRPSRKGLPESSSVHDCVPIPAGRATLGVDAGERPFSWDNERGRHRVNVPRFTIDRQNTSNGEFLEFVEAGGYGAPHLWDAAAWRWREANGVAHPPFWIRQDDAWLWRGMFEAIPLPLDAAVYVTHAEATAYARWKRRRLPTEAEFMRAAYGTPEGHERSQPWGDEAPEGGRHGNFDFQHWEPVRCGAYPDGRSAWGVDDLVGNGWEWTSTLFAPFPGFEPMPSYPEYSAEFFDGQHYVMKGASPATARELVRPTFRNWFRPHYPYVYAAVRCAGS